MITSHENRDGKHLNVMPGHSASTVKTSALFVFQNWKRTNVAMAWFSCSFLLVIFFFETDIFANEIYTNVWAVKIRGSQREVEELAIKHGFIYDRKVSTRLFQRTSCYCQK